TKPRCSIFIRKAMTSPPSPQPKQWKVPWLGRTLKDGVFSSWNGHSPFCAPPPALRSDTYSLTISSIRLRSRTSAMSLSRILPATCLSLGRTRSPPPSPPRLRRKSPAPVRIGPESPCDPQRRGPGGGVRPAPEPVDRHRLPVDRDAGRRRRRGAGGVAAPGGHRPQPDRRPGGVVDHGGQPAVPGPDAVRRGTSRA